MLGDEHPDTTNLLNNLSALLMSRGKYRSAEPLARDVFGERRESLHPASTDASGAVQELVAQVLGLAIRRHKQEGPFSGLQCGHEADEAGVRLARARPA